MAATVLIDMAAFSVALPMLPFWAERFGAGPAVIGLLLAAYSGAQLVCTPILGTLSDRIGRRPVIIGALILEAVGLVVTALSGSIAGILAGRIVSGIGGSSIGSAQAVVADVTNGPERIRAMGLIGAAIGLGFVLGPVVGGGLSLVTPAAPFWGAAVLTLLAVALVAAVLPETAGAGASAGADRPGSAEDERPAAGLARLVGIVLLSTVAFGGMEAVLPLFTQSVLGWGAARNGLAFAFVGLVMVAVQGGLVRRLARRTAEHRLLLAGLAALAIGLAAFPLVSSVGTLAVILCVVALGVGLTNPASAAMLSRAGPTEDRGRTLGLGRAAGSLGRIVGPAAAGILFARLAPGAPFVLGAVLALGGIVLLLVPGRSPVGRRPEEAIGA
jgi:DHA1 family tetracycline resistance protein-like MFS transporter